MRPRPIVGGFDEPREAARHWARQNGIISKRYGYLYAVSDTAMGRLPAAVRGSGRLRPETSSPYPELALRTKSTNPRYARVLRGWNELADKLVGSNIIVLGSNGRWVLQPGL